jgi:hypothetical protein
MPHQPSTWILAAGAFNLALALFHLCFWRIFGWPQSLAQSGTLNRSVTQILNLAITFLFALSGLVCILFPADLAGTALGHFWLLAMAIFWLARAFVQPIFFGLRHPASLAIFVVFALGCAIHAVAWSGARGF